MINEVRNDSRDREVMVSEGFNLLEKGNLIHVSGISRIQRILKEGILSPAEILRRQGKAIRNPGFWLPNDNLVAKFLKLGDEDEWINFKMLHNHLRIFGKFDKDHGIGYVTTRKDMGRLSDGKPYFGVDSMLPSTDIRAVVIPVFPLLIKKLNQFESPINKIHIEEVITSVTQAIDEGTIMKPFYIVDHFGRKISEIE